MLLDEIEKAHPDVFNILLQVLDDGRLTDGQGRTVDFKNTVIIMTSNLGSEIIQENALSDSYEEIKKKLSAVLQKSFKPEFLNRIDETVVFHPLSKDNSKDIAKIQLKKLQERLAQNGFEIDFTEKLLDIIVEYGYDQIFGARPLKRAIQNIVENKLAHIVLNGGLMPEKKQFIDFDEQKEEIVVI